MTEDEDWQECWKVARRINGWLTVREGRLLFDTARALPASGSTHGRIVEIGSFFGRSTVCLARGSRLGSTARIIAIDPHIGSPKHETQMGCTDTWPHFLANLDAAGVRDLVTPIQKTSLDASADVGDPIDFLFIDGSHDEGDVEADFATWFPRLEVGAAVAFHDSWHMAGVRRVSSRLLRSSHELADPRLVDTITIARKVAENTEEQRRQNRRFVRARRVRGLSGFLRLTYRGTMLEHVQDQPGAALVRAQT